MKLLRPEVSLEQGSLQLVAKLYLLELDHRPPFLLALEVLMPIDRAVVLSAPLLVPLQPHPHFACGVGRLPLMAELAHEADCPGAIVEDDSAVEELGGVGEVVVLESSGFGFEEVVFVLSCWIHDI